MHPSLHGRNLWYFMPQRCWSTHPCRQVRLCRPFEIRKVLVLISSGDHFIPSDSPWRVPRANAITNRTPLPSKGSRHELANLCNVERLHFVLFNGWRLRQCDDVTDDDSAALRLVSPMLAVLQVASFGSRSRSLAWLAPIGEIQHEPHVAAEV